MSIHRALLNLKVAIDTLEEQTRAGNDNAVTNEKYVELMKLTADLIFALSRIPILHFPTHKK